MAQLAGVSVRTLHLYDQIGLLKPAVRTEANYRLYGEPELLRLQQILFFKEMDFSLQDIRTFLDSPDFDLIEALESHKTALKAKQERISMMIETVDKTLNTLKNNKMPKHEDLYEGFPKEQAKAYRKEAVGKYGKYAVEKSEQFLGKLTKAQILALKAEQEDITTQLRALMNEDATSPDVQAQIARHYANTRMFWGTAHSSDKQAEAYIGLGEMYTTDGRFYALNDEPQPEFTAFLSKAMRFFGERL
jgi:DNA-binding transcriptional MerR regulator